MNETNWGDCFTANFITHEDWYVAWNETQDSIIGKYRTYEEAKQAIINYAKHLDPEKCSIHML